MNRAVVYARVMPYICIILALGAVVFYVGYAIDQNNKRTCRLYELIYQPQPDTPVPNPANPREKRASEVRSEVGKLINEYDCRE